MSGRFLRLGEWIYLRTRVSFLRRFYFWLFALLVRRRVVTRVRQDCRFRLDLGESIDLQLFLGRFEPEVTRCLRELAREGMTVMDIGANIGAHTLLLARGVGPSGRVIAFEPTDFAWAKLNTNLSLNEFSWVTPVKAALSDHVAPAKRVDFRASWRTNGLRTDGESTVDFIRLDEWCEENLCEGIDLIKIDIDGNEFGAFVGAKKTLETEKPVIVMEVVGPHLDDSERNPLRLLSELGYRFFTLASHTPLSVTQMRSMLPAGDTGMTKSMNILAVHEGRTDVFKKVV